MAGPPSPEKPYDPFPATVAMMPVDASILADAVVAGIDDEQVACRVEGDAVGHGETCLVRGVAVVGELRPAGADHRGDRAVGRSTFRMRLFAPSAM